MSDKESGDEEVQKESDEEEEIELGTAVVSTPLM